MFKDFLKNLSGGFDVVKESSVDLFNNAKENLSNAFEYGREVVEGGDVDPELQTYIENERKNEVVNSAKNFVSQSANKISEFTGFDKLFASYQAEKEKQRQFGLDVDAGLIDKEDKSIFGNVPKTQAEYFVEGIPDAWMDTIIGKNRSLDKDEIGGVAGIAYEIATGLVRAPVAIANFASGKVGEQMNNVQEYLGGERTFDEQTNNWVKDGSAFLDDTNPELAEAYRSFFGIKDTEDGFQDEVSIERAGKEYSDIINLIPGVNIEDGSNSMIAVGVIGSLLDVVPGSSGSKSAITNIVKRAKNSDEIIDALKLLGKNVTDEDAVRFGNQLFDQFSNNKNATKIEIEKALNAEDISDSTISFIKSDDGKIVDNLEDSEVIENITKNAEDAEIKKFDESVDGVPKNSTVDEIVESDELTRALNEGALTEQQIEPILNARKIQDDIEDPLSKIFDELNAGTEVSDEFADAFKEYSKSKKNIFNIDYFKNSPIKKQAEFLQTLVSKQDELLELTKGRTNLSQYVKSIDAGFVDDLADLADEADDITKGLIETVKSNVDGALDAFRNNRVAEAVEKSSRARVTTSSLGGALRALQDIAGKETGIEKVFGDVVSYLRKQGKSNGDIANAIEAKAKSLGKNVSDLDEIELKSVAVDGQSVKAKVADLIDQYRYSNMLSNLATHLVNLTSNTIDNTFLRASDELGATFAEKVLGIRGVGREAEDIASYFGTMIDNKTVNKALEKARRVFGETEEFSHTDFEKTIKAGGPIAKAYRTPLRFLEASDAMAFEFVYEAQKRVNLIREARKAGLDNVNDLSATARNRASAKAKATAEDNIFRMTSEGANDGMITQLFKESANLINNVGRISKEKAGVNIPKLFIPFVNTIAILGKKTLRSTPLLGMLDVVKANGKTIDDVAGLVGEQATGLAMTLAGYGIYKSTPDVYKGERGDKSATSTRYSDAEGNNYNSVRVGEDWNDIDALGPRAPMLLLGMKIAEIEEKFKSNKKERGEMIGAVLTAMTLGQFKESFNNEFMGSTFDILSAVNEGDGNTWAKVIANSLRQFSPYSSMLGALNKAGFDERKVVSPELDTKEIITHAFRDFLNPVELAKGNVEFISETIPQREDRDGVPLFYGDPNDSTGERLLDAVSPLRPQKRDEDIHNKFLQAKATEDTRAKSKEDTQYTKREEAEQSKIWKKYAEEGIESITEEERKKMENLSPRRIDELERDHLNNSLGVYGGYLDAHFEGRLTQKGREALGKLSDEQYQAVKKKWDSKNYARMKEVVYIMNTQGKEKLSETDRVWAEKMYAEEPDIFFKAENYYAKTYGQN